MQQFSRERMSRSDLRCLCAYLSLRETGACHCRYFFAFFFRAAAAALDALIAISRRRFAVSLVMRSAETSAIASEISRSFLFFVMYRLVIVQSCPKDVLV